MKTVTTGVGFQDPLGNLVLSGKLVLTLSQSAEVTSGGGLIAPKTVVLPLDAVTAKIASTQIYFNDELTPSGTTYAAELLDSGGNKIADFGQWSIQGASADLSTMVPVSSATISLPGVVLTAPATDQTISQHNLTVTNNVSVGGTLGVTGAFTASASINGITTCPANGANFSANLNAGIALTISGGILDARNLQGAQSMAADVTINKPLTILLGNMVLSGTGRFIVSQAAVANVSLVGITCFPTSAFGTYFNYTGTDTALKIGSSAGVTTRFYGAFLNITTGATALGAVQVNRTQFYKFDNCTFTGPAGASTQIGVLSDGTGGFCSDGIFDNCIISQFHIACRMTGPVSGNNANQFIGGTYQASGKADTGSIALDIVTGDSNMTLGCDLESADIGVQFGANATHNVLPAIRMEGATINTHVKVIAGATYNRVESVLQVGTAGGFVFTNAGGLTNSVLLVGNLGSDGNNFTQLNATDSSMFYNMIAGSTTDQIEGINFKDHTQSAQGSIYQDASKNIFIDTGNGTTHHLSARPGVSTDLNAPSTFPLRFNVSSGTGMQFWNSTQSFHTDLTPPAVNASLPVTIASGTSTLTANAALGAVTSQAAITTGATNTLTTDTIAWDYASAPGAGDSLCIVSAYVTAGNVNFVRSNPTAAAQNVSAIVINWRVIR